MHDRRDPNRDSELLPACPIVGTFLAWVGTSSAQHCGHSRSARHAWAALREELVAGENSGAPTSFDFDAVVSRKGNGEPLD